MRDKDLIALERAYGLIRESRAAGTESQQAGESAKALAIEKTLIKALTEDLNATASHLTTIQPLLGTFEEGEFGQDFQSLMQAVEAVSSAAQELQSRMAPPTEGEDQLALPSDDSFEEPMPEM